MIDEAGFFARRAGGETGVSLSQFGDNESGADEDTCYFASAPTSGQLIVLVHGRGSNGAFALGAAPSGFTLAHSSGSVASPVQVYTKVAGGSEPDNYTTSSIAGTVTLCGYVFDGASTVDVVEGYNASTITSIDIPTTTQSVAAGSFVIGFRVCNGSAGSATSWDNSFSSRFEWTGAREYRGAVGDRAYTEAATLQDVTASWTTAEDKNRTLWIEVSI